MRGKSNRSGRRLGYTLTEMMMVVSIIGVTSSTAAFQWARNRPKHDLNRACWEVMGILREARSEAARQGVPTVLTVNNSRRRITIWTDTNGNGARDQGEERHLDLSDIRNISIWSWPSTGGSFTPLGTFSHSNMNFMLVQISNPSRGEYRLVRVYPSGQVELEDQ